MKTINVSDKAAKIIEVLRKENKYFQTKSFICDAIEAATFLSGKIENVEIIIEQLTDYNRLCRYLGDTIDGEK